MSEFDNSRQRSWRFHASESEVIGSGIDLAFASLTQTIPQVLVRVERSC